MFGKFIEKKAQEHAKKEFPHESVGAVIRTNSSAKSGPAFEYIELKNIADDKKNNFLVSKEELFKIIQNIAGIIHSHCACQNDDCARLFPSKADMESQLAFKVPFGIIYADNEIASEIQWFGDSVPKADLVGRFFIHGIQDCYSLARDFYKKKLGIDLIDFPRDWEWWHKNEELYITGFSQAGFVESSLSKIKYGDLILMAVTPDTARVQNPCHCGIYLGNEMMLHHLSANKAYDKSRVSCKANILRYKDLITHVITHKDNNHAHD